MGERGLNEYHVRKTDSLSLSEVPHSTHMKTNTWKSIGAVVAGIVAITVASTAVDILLHAVGVYPPVGRPMDDGLALLASSYRLAISVAGAWLTARLAPDRPMRHALILGGVGTVLGLVGLIATWNLDLSPRWFPISLVILAIPQSWVGGRIHAMRARGSRITDKG